MKKKLPKFRPEAAERDFWADHDSADYLDWSKGKRAVLPKLKPTPRSISLRLPQSMIAELKLLANKRDVPYRSLMKVFLYERIRDELRK